MNIREMVTMDETDIIQSETKGGIMRETSIWLGLVLIILNGCASLNYSKNSDCLIEKYAVKNTVERLFISTDNRDWSGVKDVFADKVHFDMTSLAGGEPVTLTSQEIVDAWDKGLKAILI